MFIITILYFNYKLIKKKSQESYWFCTYSTSETAEVCNEYKQTGVFTEFIRNHTYIHQERMYCTYSLQLACQRTEISSGLAVLVQNGLQVVY